MSVLSEGREEDVGDRDSEREERREEEKKRRDVDEKGAEEKS